MRANSYEAEIAEAWERVRSVPSHIIETSWGRVEYAVTGRGQPVLMSHGLMGGHPQGLGMVTTYFGDGFAIAPSRIGYFASGLPASATPAIQADVYAELLDALDVERCVAIGFSAGGPSTIELALRHPERVELLVLASSALPRAFAPMPKIVKTFAPPLMKLALTSDRPFWLFKTLMPRTFRHLLGVPKNFAASEAEASTLEEIAQSIFPVRPRREGAVFDAFTGNPHVDTCPIQDITVPTLIIHAADDALAPYKSACDAAARIPRARLVTVDAGGHEFLGHEALVRDAIHSYLLELHESQKVEIQDEQQLVSS
jgi:pimeloyl-ACP methyl ester carboxylesterase